MKKILIIATDDYLGAGRASFRIYETLKNEGHEVRLLVKNKTRYNDDHIIAYDELVKKNFSERARSYLQRKLTSTSNFSTDPDYYFFEHTYSGVNIRKLVLKLPFVPDIIVATWISRFLKASDLSLLQQLTNSSLVLYPMDMSLFTGGCHYAWDSKGYISDCNNCPAILDGKKKYIAQKNLLEKQTSFKNSGAKLITASDELLKQAQQSTIFKAQQHIPKILLPVDEKVFSNNDRLEARRRFKITDEEKVIFFGASLTEEKRKGVHLFINSLELLKKDYLPGKSDVCIMIAGKSNNSELYRSIPFKVVFTGYIDNDEELSMAYRAADIFVCTSLQDSGPMMINESVMSGTPVVSFSIGVTADLVEDNISGFKVDIGDTKMLAQKMHEILSLNEQQYKSLRESTRRLAEGKTSTKVFLTSFVAD